MTNDTPPKSVRELELRLRAAEGETELVNRRRVSMALVVVGQMLPSGAIKGGSAMALRYGRGTRFTKDLDAARSNSLDAFREDFEQRLHLGWGGFTGRLIARPAPTPAGVPAAYVMQPFDVKLSYDGSSWCTVKFELGHNEIGDTDDPETVLADDLAALFVEVGLPRPEPVHVVRSDHQIAQKLHAATGPNSERAHDLVDLQLLARGKEVNLGQVRAVCVRLFDYRDGHAWPPTVTVNSNWDSLYADSAEDVDVLESVEEAAVWANDFIERIDAATDP